MSQLRKLREAHGLTQAELARLAGVSRQLIGAAESGRHLPAVDAAIRIAAALDVSVEEAFAGTRSALAPVQLLAEVTPGTPLRVARVGDVRIAIPLGDLSGRGFFSVADAVASREGVRVLPGAHIDGLVVAGCDPALGIAEALLSHLGPKRLIGLYQSTGRAIRLLRDGLVHGVLVHGPEDALPSAPIAVRRWRVASWQAGIAFAPELGHPTLEALVAGEIELAQREAAAASQQALVRALAQLGGTPPPGPLVSGHLEGARHTAITRGAAVSMEPAADAFGLGFFPLETHVVELWIDRGWQDHGGVAPLIELLGLARFRDRVSVFGGYDLSGAGTALEAA
jgi:transcriptional regulator with XRE-family HTH domain